MERDITYLKEQLHDARRYLSREQEELQAQIDTQNTYLEILDYVDSLLDENEQLKRDNEQLQSDYEQQLEENESLRQQLNDKDMKLKELSKFSVNVAKKLSQEGLEKAFRVYINTSKRKTQAKREVARAQLLDFITTAKLEMSDDIMEALNQLDDVVVEPAPVNTTVNVQPGGINVQQANTVAK